MKRILLALLLIFTLLVSSTFFTACEFFTHDTGDGTTSDGTNNEQPEKPDGEKPEQPGEPDQPDEPIEPVEKPHSHAYQYCLITYGDGFALEGHCSADKCDYPTVIVDEGLIPEYEYTEPTCVSIGSSTWSYKKDGKVYTLQVVLPSVSDNHTYDDESCIYCGADKPDNQPDQPKHAHSWVDATCITPMICSTCGTTSGNALGHSWTEATCTVAKTCSTCNTTSGNALGHSWTEATCTVAKTCSACNTTSGNALGHSYSGGSCTVCGDKDPSYVPPSGDHTHTDANNDDKCDSCYESVVIVVDFYALNDLHGKFCDTDTQPGVDELGTFLKTREDYDDNVIILSSGDMWQGAAESNLTNGLILTEWMNAMGFASMTIGNHEYDWGEDKIRENLAVADFPFLAINIYDKSTGKLADYCTPSVVVDLGEIQVGIIGAIGDVYSSISSDMVSGVEFKVGSELTSLVKAESDRLRGMGADLIVYSIHNGSADNSLSNGYVDIVFEGHTHSNYVKTDSYGVYHLQGGGENEGICHAEISVNFVTGKTKVNEAEFVDNSVYSGLEDDPETEAIEDKYADIIDMAYTVIGNISIKQSSTTIKNIVAELYLEAGLERWGDKYKIVLGGGYLSTRSPYDLAAGAVTYSDILSLLPFDNQLTLCSISGKNLKSKFINTTNSNYYNAYSDYYNTIKNNISNNETYYVIVDSYTAFYAPNNLTVVEYYDEGVFARDLLAAEVKAGRFDNGGSSGSGGNGNGSGSGGNNSENDNFTLTSIPEILAIGNALSSNAQTYDYYYVKGKIVIIENTTYGNMYIEDESGNQLYIYGLNDANNNRYGYMSNPPKVGDIITVYAPIKKYYSYGSYIIELMSAKLIDVE